MHTVLPDCIACYPTVFAVNNEYQIFIPFKSSAIVWIQVGENTYFDDSNGILRSNINIHRILVPTDKLDYYKEYTVCYRLMIDRRPYFPISEDERRFTVTFKPIVSGKLNIYLLSDAHNLEAEPVKAGSYFGDDLDLLILNGDIPNHSGDIENFNSVYRIASGITKGRIPVVFSRGNHDTRGIHAEEFGLYTPTYMGKTYYTFRVGSVWGLVLDCGEDKPDTNDEYGNTICFHNFRLQETQFLEKVVASAKSEYDAPDIEYKLIICHIPFTHTFKPPFNIEKDIYSQWANLLREHIRPHLLLFGHMHQSRFCPIGDEWDDLGQPCDAVVAGIPFKSTEKNVDYCGAAIQFIGKHGTVLFNKASGVIEGKHEFLLHD